MGEPDLDEEFALFEQEIAAVENETGAEDGGAGDASSTADGKVTESAASKDATNDKSADKTKGSGPVDRRKVFASAPVSNVDEEELYKPAENKAAGMPGWAQGSATSKPGFAPAFGAPMMPPPSVPPPSQPALPPPATPAPQNPQQKYGQQPGASKSEPKKEQKFMRTAGGKKWEDTTLADWPENDYRMFCGNLGNEVDDSVLARSFGKYPSFQKAKIARDGRTKKPKGYGFVSFSDPADFTKALKEMQGKYVGNRPVKVMRSTYQDRNLELGDPNKKKKQRTAQSLV